MLPILEAEDVQHNYTSLASNDSQHAPGDGSLEEDAYEDAFEGNVNLDHQKHLSAEGETLQGEVSDDRTSEIHEDKSEKETHDDVVGKDSSSSSNDQSNVKDSFSVADKVETKRDFGFMSLIFMIILLPFRLYDGYSTIFWKMMISLLRLDLTHPVFFHDSDEMKAKRDFGHERLILKKIVLPSCIALAFFTTYCNFMDGMTDLFQLIYHKDWGFHSTTLSLIVKFLFTLHLYHVNILTMFNCGGLLMRLYKISPFPLELTPDSNQWFIIFCSIGRGIMCNVITLLYLSLKGVGTQSWLPDR